MQWDGLSYLATTMRLRGRRFSFPNFHTKLEVIQCFGAGTTNLNSESATTSSSRVFKLSFLGEVTITLNGY